MDARLSADTSRRLNQLGDFREVIRQKEGQRKPPDQFKLIEGGFDMARIRVGDDDVLIVLP